MMNFLSYKTITIIIIVINVLFLGPKLIISINNCLLMFQMMRVHHGTVDSYLEDIIMQSLERTADEQVSHRVAVIEFFSEESNSTSQSCDIIIFSSWLCAIHVFSLIPPSMHENCSSLLMLLS